MSKLYSSNKIIKVLRKRGFVCVSQKGSHAKFRKTLSNGLTSGGLTLTVIVPVGRKEIPLGTFKSILRQANLTDGDLRNK